MVIAVLLGFSYLWTNYHEYGVTIDNPELSSIEVGEEVTIEGDLSSYKPTQSTIKKQDIFKLRKGRYTIRISRQGYESKFTSIAVPKNKAFSAPKLSLNKVSLSEIKQKNTSSVGTVVDEAITQYNLTGYSTSSEHYFDGTWYAALLSPAAADAGSLDTVRLILKKTANGWTVAVPPTIVIYNKKYPKVPKNVISYTNNALR